MSEIHDRMFQPLKYDIGLMDRVENLYFKVTFHPISNGIFSFEGQNFSTTTLGGDLIDALSRYY